MDKIKLYYLPNPSALDENACKKRRGYDDLTSISTTVLTDKKVLHEKFSPHLLSKLQRNNKIRHPYSKRPTPISSQKSRELWKKQRSYSLSVSSSQSSKSITSSLTKLHSIYNLQIQQSNSYAPDQSLRAIAKGITLMEKSCMQLNLVRPWSLSDTGLKAFAACFYQLNNLRRLTLNIRGEGLTDEGMKPFSNYLENLKSLTTLKFNFNSCTNLTPRGLKSFALSLRVLTRLSNLHLSFEECENLNELGLIILKYVPIRSENISKLQVDLQENNFRMSGRGHNQLDGSPLLLDIEFKKCLAITDYGLLCIAKTIKKMKYVSDLSLNFHTSPQVTPTTIEEFLACLKEFKNLTLVNFDCNIPLNPTHSLNFLHENWDLKQLCLKFKCANYNKAELQPFLKNSSRMSNLQLHFRQGEKELTDSDIKNILASLHGLNTLSELNLNFSIKSITYAGFESLCENIIERKSLQTLALTFHECQRLGDKNVQMIAISLQNLRQLRNLSLNLGNSGLISDYGLIYLFQTIQDLNKIKYLNLKFRHLTNLYGECFKALISNPSKMKNLAKLNLGFLGCKNLDDNGIYSICSSLVRASSLRELNLHMIHCDSIGNESLNYVASALNEMNCLVNVELDFSLCQRITSLEFSTFCENVKQLPFNTTITPSFF